MINTVFNKFIEYIFIFFIIMNNNTTNSINSRSFSKFSSIFCINIFNYFSFSRRRFNRSFNFNRRNICKYCLTSIICYYFSPRRGSITGLINSCSIICNYFRSRFWYSSFFSRNRFSINFSGISNNFISLSLTLKSASNIACQVRPL